MAESGNTLAWLDPVGSLVSGAIGGLGSIIAGNQQAKAQREANRLNYQMFQEQLGFTEKMWNKQNEYNTPLAQRSRFEEAGINPYFALGKMEAGNAQSVTSPAPNPAMPVDAAGAGIGLAGQSLASGVQSAAHSYTQQLLLAEQIAGQQEAVKAQMIKNRFAVAHENNQIQREWYELSNLVKSGKLTDEQINETRQRMRKLIRESRMLDIDLKYYDDFLSSRNREQRESANKMREEAREAGLKADYQDMINDAFPALTELQKQSLAASAFAAFKSGELSSQLSQSEKVKRVGEIIANGIAAKDYALKQLQISQQDLEAARRGDVSKLRKNSKFFRFIDDIITYAADKGSLILGGAAGAALKSGKSAKSFSKGVQTGPNTYEWH